MHCSPTFITCCHDEDTSDTLYTYNRINGPILDQSESISRPNFAEGGMYPEDITVDDCYKQVGQIATVAQLVSTQYSHRHIFKSLNMKNYEITFHTMSVSDFSWVHKLKLINISTLKRVYSCHVAICVLMRMEFMLMKREQRKNMKNQVKLYSFYLHIFHA